MARTSRAVVNQAWLAEVKLFPLLLTAVATGVAGACANASAPPGGPPDPLPPVVTGVTPASGTTDVQPREVEISFDEVISEVPQGAQDLGALVFISPKSGVPRVSWHRTRITIRPREGFQPNRVYTVEVRPGITDLRSNKIDTAIRVVFSTGGPIPDTRVSGAAFDWVAGRPAGRALIEAIAPDSTTYQTLADSVGRFELHNVPPGGYVLRAVIDRNNNRELEPLEPWDTTSIVITADVRAELYAFQHDTLPMRVQTVAYNDSLNELRLVFDKPFAPGATITPAQFRLISADSVVVPIDSIITLPQRRLADSLVRQQREDSIARAQADTTEAGRARADSIARQRVADSIAAVAREAEQRRLEAQRRGIRLAPVDTTPPPRLSRPVPFAEIFLKPATTLEPGTTYILTAEGLQSISGTTSPTPARGFAVPRRQPPRDSLR